jgi:Holliday junction resolvase RusA-like endonuclease
LVGVYSKQKQVSIWVFRVTLDVTFTILGEPASKANSRRLVSFGKLPALIKSQKALDYGKSFIAQCHGLVPEVVTCDVSVEMLIIYSSRRPDLDESLILDLMQGVVYANDRQVKERHAYWGLDKENPRTIIRVRECRGEIPDYLKP